MCAINSSRHDVHSARLVRDSRLSRDHFAARLVFPAKRGEEHGELFRVGAHRFLVAGGNVDGCHHVRRGHTSAGRGTRLHARNRGQLAVVGVPAVWNDDGVPVRAAVAAIRLDDRRAVCRDALRRKARRVLARVSRDLSRPADELPDPGLGHQGDDWDCFHHDGANDAGLAAARRVFEFPQPYLRPDIFGARRASAGGVHLLPDSVHRNLRHVGRTYGRVVDRPVSVCAENVDRDRRRVLRGEGCGRDGLHPFEH